MALSLGRAFGALGAEASRFDRRKNTVDPELGLLSAEDMQIANFMLPGPNMVRAPGGICMRPRPRHLVTHRPALRPCSSVRTAGLRACNFQTTTQRDGFGASEFSG